LTAKTPKPPNEEVVDRQDAKDAKGLRVSDPGPCDPDPEPSQLRSGLAVLAFWRFKLSGLGILCVLAVKPSDVPPTAVFVGLRQG